MPLASTSRRVLLMVAIPLAAAVLCICRAAAALPALQAEGAAVSPAETLARARSAYERGDAATATTLFSAVLRVRPTDYEANETLGLMHAEAGEFAAALPFFETAVGADPTEPLAQVNLGSVLLRLGRGSEAVPPLKRAVELKPQDAQAQATLARALLETGANQQAAEHFKSAASLGRTDADLLYNWALSLLSTDPATAVRVLEQIGPADRNEGVESLFGDAEERAGHSPAAVVHLRRAAELSPTEDNLYGLAAELLRHWSWTEGEAVARYGRQRFPASERLRMALGVAEFGEARYAEAAQDFAALLESAPASALYGDMLGRACDAMPDENAGTCSALQQFADQHPGNAQIAIYAASSILRSPGDSQDLARARRLLDDALRSDPRASEAFYQRGVLDQRELRWSDSVDDLQHAIALRPTSAQAHYRLSRAFYRLGDKVHGDEQMLLQQHYAAEEKQELDQRLKEVTHFIFASPR